MSVDFTYVRSCANQKYIFEKFELYFDFLQTFYGLIGFFNNVLHMTLDNDWFFEQYIFIYFIYLFRIFKQDDP